MRIEKDQFIAGLPAREVRRFMRSAPGENIQPGRVTQVLGFVDEDARQFLKKLKTEGLIAAKDNRWEATAKGYAFRMATAARPLRRATAEKLVDEVVQRAQLINGDVNFAYWVDQLVMFGSMVKGAERPNDVDIACKLSPRFEGERQRSLLEKRRENKESFRNATEWAVWPKLEVFKQLKSRSRGLSIHELRDEDLKRKKHKVIFLDKRNTHRGRRRK